LAGVSRINILYQHLLNPSLIALGPFSGAAGDEVVEALEAIAFFCLTELVFPKAAGVLGRGE
jgi:hypothetical protein